MKYLKQAIIESGTIYGYISRIVLSAIALVINANQIIWITNAFSNPSKANHYINLLIGGIVICFFIDAYIERNASVINHKTFRKLSEIFFLKVNSLDYDAFVSISPASILTSANNIWRVSKLPMITIGFIRNIIQVLITIGAITILSKEVVIPVIAVYILMAYVGLKLFKMWGEIDKKIDDNNHKRAAEIEMCVSGFQEIRAFNTQDYHWKRFEDIFEGGGNLILKRSIVNLYITGTFQIVDGLVTIGMVLYLLRCIDTNVIIASSATAVIVLVWRLIEPLISIIDFMDQYSELTAPIPKLEKVLDYNNKVENGTINFNGSISSIRFKNVGFQYDKSSDVLSDINLKIKRGEHIGICGPSGQGKSTLIKLIPRFYDPTEGQILIDGIDLKNYNINTIRDKIGIVSQDMYIFDGTILDNVKYGSEHASVLDVTEACRKADILDFINSLEKKFDTEVGSRGIKLSGGQKQRLALARVFLKDPEIILLDEATAALDNESETVIQKSLDLFRNKTIISVAHRLSTIKDSDRIYVIDKHKIIESGSHLELVEKKGVYFNMLK